MTPDELAAMMETTGRPNWYLRLPRQVKSDLCQVRRAYASADRKPAQPVLLARLRAKYEGLPTNTKRFGEFLRDEAGIYPDEECADGQD